MYLLIFDRLWAERRILFVKGSLAFMTGVHLKVATIMKETELGTRCRRRTMDVSCRLIASGSIRVTRYNNNNNNQVHQHSYLSLVHYQAPNWESLVPQSNLSCLRLPLQLFDYHVC